MPRQSVPRSQSKNLLQESKVQPSKLQQNKVLQNKNSVVSAKLKTAISDLRAFENLLRSDELDPRLLGDFRDALNRVRNVAWAAQQSVAARLSDKNGNDVSTLLAGERIRAAYQLCRAVQEDLTRDGIDFQKGQLSELQTVTTELTKQIGNRL